MRHPLYLIPHIIAKEFFNHEKTNALISDISLKAYHKNFELNQFKICLKRKKKESITHRDSLWKLQTLTSKSTLALVPQINN